MYEARIYASFAEVPRAPNGRLLTGAAESWEFYQAIGNIPPPGFVLGAIAAGEGADVAAVAPLFRTSYRLDTPFQGPWMQPCHSITPTCCREIPIFIEHLGNQSWAGYCFCAFDPDPRAIFRCAETPSSWALESARRRHHSELLACGGSSAV